MRMGRLESCSASAADPIPSEAKPPIACYAPITPNDLHAFDDQPSVYCTAKSMLGRLAIGRALVPSLRRFDRRELGDDDAFSLGPLQRHVLAVCRQHLDRMPLHR